MDLLILTIIYAALLYITIKLMRVGQLLDSMMSIYHARQVSHALRAVFFVALGVGIKTIMG